MQPGPLLFSGVVTAPGESGHLNTGSGSCAHIGAAQGPLQEQVALGEGGKVSCSVAFPAGNAPAGKDREAQKPPASWWGLKKRMGGGEGCFWKGKVARMR